MGETEDSDLLNILLLIEIKIKPFRTLTLCLMWQKEIKANISNLHVFTQAVQMISSEFWSDSGTAFIMILVEEHYTRNWKQAVHDQVFRVH